MDLQQHMVTCEYLAGSDPFVSASEAGRVEAHVQFLQREAGRRAMVQNSFWKPFCYIHCYVECIGVMTRYIVNHGLF